MTKVFHIAVQISSIRTRFPVICKVGNVDILYCVKFENKLDKVTNYINFKSVHCDKYKSAKILIQLETVSNVFTLEVVQKCQHCQLCVLREHSKDILSRDISLVLPFRPCKMQYNSIMYFKSMFCTL